jgi:hypothetical protein
MLTQDINTKQTELLGTVALDYLKTSSVLYGLSFLTSNLVSKDDFKPEISSLLQVATAGNIVELLNLVDTINQISKKTVYGVATNPFRNDIFVIDFSTIYQLHYLKMNKLFSYIESAYPKVIELIEFLHKQTEFEYKNYSKGLVNTENSKRLSSSFEALQKHKQISNFLEDFAPLAKSNMIKKISELYSNAILPEDSTYLFKKSSQTSFALLNGLNLIMPISYFASKGQLACGGDCEYSIADFSQIALLLGYNKIETSAREDLLPLNNFTFLRRSVICSGSQNKLLHFIRSSVYKNEIDKSREAESMSYDFLSASNISELTSSKEDTSSFLAIMQYINFARNLKNVEKEIDIEINAIIANKESDLASTLTEIELYMREISVRLMGGIKLKNHKDNASFYTALRELLRSKTSSYIARSMNV